MIKIMHRVNTISQLKSTSSCLGVEMDLHAFGEELVVHHDPFIHGEHFSDWLKYYNHSFVILNLKEEGIETKTLEMLKNSSVGGNYFLLDLSFPSLIKLIRAGEKNIAIRVSKYEDLGTAKQLSGKAKWVWLDMFEDHVPISAEEFRGLQGLGYQICLVSPELHCRKVSAIKVIKLLLEEMSIKIDAICTKRPELW